jgi:DNA polymerase III sliding clamp (beta) subunit (PCNA family)
MLDLLKTMHKIISKKSITPILSHAYINDGEVTMMNDALSIKAHFEEFTGITATVQADRFVAAVIACNGNPQIKASDKTLTLRSGKFSARLPLNNDPYPSTEWGGKFAKLTEDFPAKLKMAKAFMGGRFAGVLLKDSACYATNNNAMVKIALPNMACTDISLPAVAVDFIVGLNEQPTRFKMSKNYIILEYPGFSLRSRLLDLVWPDVAQFFEFEPATLPDVPDGFSDAVATVAGFTLDNSIAVSDGTVIGGEAEIAGFNEIADFTMMAKTLIALLGCTTKADFTQSPFRFSGDGVLGVCAEKRS